jgi:PhnB protein
MAAAPRVYVNFPGTAREALEFYAEVFGGELRLFSYAEFGRTDGPAEAVAHGELDGLVSLGGADVGPGEEAVVVQGWLLSLIGTADPTTLHSWFDALADRGRVVDALQERPWGASDGQVVDRFGLRWLIGYEPAP